MANGAKTESYDAMIRRILSFIVKYPQLEPRFNVSSAKFQIHIHICKLESSLETMKNPNKIKATKHRIRFLKSKLETIEMEMLMRCL